MVTHPSHDINRPIPTKRVRKGGSERVLLEWILAGGGAGSGERGVTRCSALIVNAGYNRLQNFKV